MKKILFLTVVASVFVLAGCAGEPVKDSVTDMQQLGVDGKAVGGAVLDAGKEAGEAVVKEAVGAAKKKASTLKEAVLKQAKDTALDVGAAAVKKSAKVISGAAVSAVGAVSSGVDAAGKAVDGTSSKVTSTVKGVGGYLKNLIGE
jgi:hypothetical protein